MPFLKKRQAGALARERISNLTPDYALLSKIVPNEIILLKLNHFLQTFPVNYTYKKDKWSQKRVKDIKIEVHCPHLKNLDTRSIRRAIW